MKNILLILVFLTLFVSCEQVGDLTKDGVNANSVSQGSLLSYHGNFTGTSGITVSGGSKIYLDGNQYKLELENFSISSGPDLKVYLSKTNLPNDFVSLGNLTSQTIYAIPQTVNISDYKYVLIHCQQYNHLFAVANLIQN